MTFPLTYLPRGQHARIVWIADTAKRRQRLQTFGICPDGMISRIFISPHSRFCICQTEHSTFFLRRKTMNEIFVDIPPPRPSIS